jgi:hypothetical protein
MGGRSWQNLMNLNKDSETGVATLLSVILLTSFFNVCLASIPCFIVTLIFMILCLGGCIDGAAKELERQVSLQDAPEWINNCLE